MSFPETLPDALVSVADEWNKAEEAIKLAEQINKGIINPAVYELRYAGRRLVECIAVKDSDKKIALELAKDAHFDCCRARHDAIDAATSYMAEVIELAAVELGADVLLDKFPKITKITYLLSTVRAKVTKSRKERDDRDIIYTAIQADNLSIIMPLTKSLNVVNHF